MENRFLRPAKLARTEPLLRAHMPELDTLRGLAVLGVVFYHGLYWARDLTLYPSWEAGILRVMSVGQFGVNLFFVLSGFLITGVLIESRTQLDYYKRFYFRRALRILPAYYFTLFLLILFRLTSKGFLFMSFAYSANLSPIFGIALSYPVLWSLAVEEHFYLVWPIAGKRVSLPNLLGILGAILVLSPLSRFIYHEHAVATNTVGAGYGFYTWNNLDGLAVGSIIAIVARLPGCRREQMRLLAGFLALLAILIAVVGYPFGIMTRRNALGDALQYVPWNFGFAALMVTFILLGSGLHGRLTRPSFLIFFGRISYGLYLYHLMVFVAYNWFIRKTHFVFPANSTLWAQAWARMVIAGTASVIAAYLSRRYFEEPFLRLKNRMSKP
jgi:peptidoglycan/LPS O-acetylase OafA/YrhL